MNRDLSSVALCALALLSAVACHSDGLNEQDELQALLRDDALTQVEPSSTPASDAASPAARHAHLIAPGASPAGAWSFDDCTPARSQLADATPNGNTAFRAVGVTCTTGIEGTQAVAIAAREDIVYVPDQPSFTFQTGVTVAGWFNPTTTGGTRTLFRKRDRGTSSFALLLHRGAFRFVVSLGPGRAISVTSPASATAGVFQHVAGTYDGTTLRLYVNGVEVSSLAASGTIPPGPGPLVMGNDGSERRFDGAIDDTLFATHALTADQVLALLCFPRAPTLAITPDTLPQIVANMPRTIDVALTNNNPPICAPITFSLDSSVSDDRLRLDPPAFTVVHSAPVPGGATGHVAVTATLLDQLAAGTMFSVVLDVNEPTTGFSGSHRFDITVLDPADCGVDTERELMIKNTLVVDDPVRTVFNPTSTDPRNGVWTFKHLVESMAPTPADAPAMVEAMLHSFTVPQVINGFTVPARPSMQTYINRWPRTPDGALDLAQAPMRLFAIVNRFDLRDPSHGDAGEGRFVFGLTGRFGEALVAQWIFNYKLPAATSQDVLDWARSFHALGTIDFGEDYNAHLQVITERFAGRGARPDHPNGSALDAVQSNEVEFSPFPLVWQMRQFRLSAGSGLPAPATLDQTPDGGFSGSATLVSYINANQADILADRHTVPEVFNGAPFRAGAVFNNFTWLAPGTDSEARFHFALNTCNGCHGSETGTGSRHISRDIGPVEADLSGFLTGITVADPVTGQPRTFNDLLRRSLDLQAAICPGLTVGPGASGHSMSSDLNVP